MTPLPLKISSAFELTCCHYEGIEAIKLALTEGEKLSTNDVVVKCRIIAAPLYECYTNTIKAEEGFKVISEAVKRIEAEIMKKQGDFVLKTKHNLHGKNANLYELVNLRDDKDDTDEEELIEFEDGNTIDDKDKNKHKNKLKIKKEDSSDGSN